jgi:hypothetical protein
LWFQEIGKASLYEHVADKIPPLFVLLYNANTTRNCDSPIGCRPLPGSEKMIPRNKPAAVAHKSLGSSGEQQGPPLERELGQSQ